MMNWKENGRKRLWSNLRGIRLEAVFCRYWSGGTKKRQGNIKIDFEMWLNLTSSRGFITTATIVLQRKSWSLGRYQLIKEQNEPRSQCVMLAHTDRIIFKYFHAVSNIDRQTHR